MSMAEWNSSYGTLFQNLINNGVPCIMVGHIRFPAYQTKKLKGVLPPATLSDELMVDLLKKEMKFNGVIMSDALNMGGVGGYYANELETSIETFKAGVDMVLWPSFVYMDSIEALINSGDIPMSRLNDAVERIWGVREKYELLNKKNSIYYELTDGDKSIIKETATLVAENAVTLIADKNNELPLNSESNKKIAIINISYNNMVSHFEYTKELLKAKGYEVDTILYNPFFYTWQAKLSYFNQFDKVLVVFENRYLSPIGSSMLKGSEAMGLWTASMIPFEKIIAISYSNPYYVNYYFDSAPIRINAYGIDKFSQKAVVDALTGDIQFVGTTPVNINNPLMN